MIRLKLCFKMLNQDAMFVKKHDICNSHEGKCDATPTALSFKMAWISMSYDF